MARGKATCSTGKAGNMEYAGGNSWLRDGALYSPTPQELTLFHPPGGQAYSLFLKVVYAGRKGWRGQSVEN